MPARWRSGYGKPITIIRTPKRPQKSAGDERTLSGFAARSGD
jgi:hypothetical protein